MSSPLPTHRAQSAMSYRSSSSSSPPSPSTSAIASPPLPNQKSNDVFNSIVKGRKSWKTLRGGEIVWPPELEAALIEGLEHYIPDNSRETRLLGRFPMRNRFISEYIYEKTGKRRTAKQVGSRLQQLRDTCGGRQLLKLLTPYRPQNRPSRPTSLNISATASDNESNSDSSVPATPTEAHAALQSLLYRGVGGLGRDEQPSNIIYIDLLPENAPIGSGATQVPPPLSSSSNTNVVRASQHPRRIRDIDPTITFVAPSSMVAKSHFMVRSRTGIVHSEATNVTLVGPVPGAARDQLLYSTKLVPAFWDQLCKSSDPTQFTIIQKVTREPYHDTSSPIFSAAYKFTLPFLSGADAVTVSTSTFTSTEPMIQESPILGFDLDDLLSFDSPSSFNELFSFEEKGMDVYDLNEYLAADWRTYSPALSISSDAFSEGYASSSTLGDIPTTVL